MTNKPIHRAIVELRKELDLIDQVIRVLEVLDSGKPRRGRPPKMLVEAVSAPPRKRRTPRRKKS